MRGYVASLASYSAGIALFPPILGPLSVALLSGIFIFPLPYVFSMQFQCVYEAPRFASRENSDVAFCSACLQFSSWFYCVPWQLFRRFAAHLDSQAKKAPNLSEGTGGGEEYGTAEGATDFLARFRFIEVVGAGSYSTVHRAIEKSTGRPVAVKVIKKEILSPDVESQILNEAVRHQS